MYAIETHQLSKHYSRGKVKALQEVSLQVPQGKIYSLLGPNGSGKTTLVKVLLGLVHATNGKAHILGEDIHASSCHDRIGYLAENHHFPGFLTAREVLYYFGRMSHIPKPDLLERIPNLLEIVALSEWSDVKIRNYSKGMMQRLGLAHALINGPDLIFLDEPTDGIDPMGRRQIRDILIELRNQGKTVFVNSHLLSEVERMSDELAILKKGRVVRSGSLQELIALQGSYQIQIKGETKPLQTLCRQMNLPFENNRHFTVQVQNETELNTLIDRIRNENIEIRAIIPEKISLEDYFIDVVEHT